MDDRRPHRGRATGHVIYFETHRTKVVQERAQARIMRRVMDILDGEG